MIFQYGWKQTNVALAILICLLAATLPAIAQSFRNKTKVVLLGTGTPLPDPDRSGPATAIIVNNSAYLIDFGPGVVRRAAAARLDKGLAELDPSNIKTVFVTHLHSDHTAGFPDLILTPWTMGRSSPLEVYGPPGLKSMADHILAAYREDINIRTQGMEKAAPAGVIVNVHEIKPGVIYKDANIMVTAFRTRHGDWKDSFGYRFDTADRSIVISGDTIPLQATVDACAGCDILIHEALTEKFLDNPMRPNSQGYDIRAYAEKYHTTTSQLVELAKKARPQLLILNHNPISLRPGKRPLASTPEDLLQEMRGYSGKVVVGRDLDIY